ncbi:hypothetical protein E3N88_18903 [Mikania micrantha]|uniref:Uncharacterized protein n=1 Tax=Mikania micrantha TaxID=192012 RepID=A0A5N6NPP9_9ASTR|nr:hypothetical protein E3N88_18903 [Mikania micrantha]
MPDGHNAYGNLPFKINGFSLTCLAHEGIIVLSTSLLGFQLVPMRRRREDRYGGGGGGGDRYSGGGGDRYRGGDRYGSRGGRGGGGYGGGNQKRSRKDDNALTC